MAASKKATKKTAQAEQEQFAIPAAPVLMYSFATEKGSPFPDGYSIEGEEKVLAEFMAGPMDESDPLYDRFIELEDRKDQLERMQAKFRARKGADLVVSEKELRGIDQLGSLVDEETDQMTVHTKEAYRLFMGRTREPGKQVNAIIGGKRVATALRGLWILTGNDNPYADWALLRHDQTMAEIQQRLEREIKDAEDALEVMRKRGLHFSVLQSAEPKVLNLGYRSPYGYAVSHLIVEYDYFVRLQKTMERKNLRSGDQVRQRIAELTRYIRRVFNETARFDRWLNREEVKTLGRTDFVPGASEDAANRVEFVSGVFGMVPSEIFTGRLQPRHSRRRIQITEAERQLLNAVGQSLAQIEQQEAATNEQQEHEAKQA